MLSYDEINIIGQITDTTWGVSSTLASPTSSIKLTLTSEDAAHLVYTTIVTYHGTAGSHELRAWFDEAQQHVKEYLKRLGKAFKDETGRVLKIKLNTLEPVMEHLDINTFSPLRAVHTAYYRCHGDVSIG